MSNNQNTAGAIGSLQGIRIIDLTTNVAGPFATQILGDLGADIIKVERPEGDDTRGWGPPVWEGNNEGVVFSSLNRNKRSVVLDLKTPEGREALDKLIVSADVVIQNMRPGAFEKLGYGWADLTRLNPGIIYCDITGYGHAGPRRNDPAYDPLMQAFSGLMSITGEDGRAPVRIPVSILDKGTGMWSVISIFDALRKRDITGEGSHLQLSLLETALSWEPGQIASYVATGKTPQRLGSATSGVAPYQAFETADGYCIVAAGNQRLWEKLCASLERNDLLSDPRYATNAQRFSNRNELTEDLTLEFSKKPSAVWVEQLKAAGVPVTPIRTIDQIVEDEQVIALEAIDRTPHPTTGTPYAMVALPMSSNGKRHPVRSYPPVLGEHNEEVLEEIKSVELPRKETTNVR